MTISLISSEAALHQAVSATVEALFGGPCNEIRPTDAQFNISAAVQITGAATATVVVRADDVISYRYAAEMFGLSTDEVSPTDVADALLELTNVLGGAAKTAIDGECVLALPFIVPLTDTPSGADEAAYEIAGGTLSVAIISDGGAL